MLQYYTNKEYQIIEQTHNQSINQYSLWFLNTVKSTYNKDLCKYH